MTDTTAPEYIVHAITANFACTRWAYSIHELRNGSMDRHVEWGSDRYDSPESARAAGRKRIEQLMRPSSTDTQAFEDWTADLQEQNYLRTGG